MLKGLSKSVRSEVYHRGEPGAQYGIWNAAKGCWQFNICEDTPMMSHVDKMLAAYEAMCRDSDNPDETRRWEALYLRFIGEERLKPDAVAERLHIDRRTFYRDIGRAMEDMAVLLFGIEAIGTWKPKSKKK